MEEVNGVLANVALMLERGLDVDGRIGDDERLGINRNVHGKDVADPPIRPKPRTGRHPRAHEFVGMQATLHKHRDLTGDGQFSGARGRCMTVRDRLDLNATQ